MVCKQISKRCISPPSWWEMPPSTHAEPKLRKPDSKCHQDRQTHTSRYCKRCQETVDEEERIKAEEEEKLLELRKDKGKRKTELRNRMRNRAKK